MNIRSKPSDQADYPRLCQSWLIYADTIYRYGVIGRALTDSSGSVLEIGGFSTGHHATLTARWPQAPVTINCQFEPGKSPDIVASGIALPIRDRAFKRVVLIDVLEHVAPPDRAAAIREALRVAEEQVLVLFPFSSKANLIAEQRLAAALKRLGRPEKKALTEHLRFGLPVVEEVVSYADPALWTAGIRFLTDRQVLFCSMHLQVFLARERSRKLIAIKCSALLTALDHIVTKHRAYRVLLSFRRNAALASLVS